jgi:heme oxygenase (biliverdin-IX-beta and delta-forming)
VHFTMIQPKIDVLGRLRRDTRLAHGRMHQLPALKQLLHSRLEIADHVFVLRKFYGFYQPIEERLRNSVAWSEFPFDFEVHSKTAFLRADLAALHIDVNDIAICGALPDTRTSSQALGCLYVLEGATLGGQVIAAKVVASQDFKSGDGVRFFLSYGARQVEVSWGEVKRLLATALGGSQTDLDEAVCAATLTFSSLENWMTNSSEDSF